MNTIYDNTFVLGETNNLTFEAGPGISISEPSEGTVRIANDETVLWSGTLTGTAGSLTAQLSEPFSAFEQIKLTMGTGYGSTYTYATSANNFQVFSPFVGNGQISLYAMMFSTNSDRTQITVPNGNCVFLQITGNSINGFQNRTAINVGEITLTKVVGVNRKEV